VNDVVYLGKRYEVDVMEKKKTSLFVIASVMLGVVAIFASVVRCVSKIQTQISNEVQRDIRYTVDQNVQFLKAEIESQYKILDEIAIGVQKYDQQNVQQIVEYIKHYEKVTDVKRLGFIDAEGTAYTTDGYEYSLKYFDTYEVPMAGEKYISDMLIDTIGEAEDINVLSVPVYAADTHKPVGAVFATYRTQNFIDTLMKESINDGEFSCIIKGDGTIILETQAVLKDKNSNLFRLMKKYDNKYEERRQNITDALQSGEYGAGQIDVDGNLEYGFVPINDIGSNEQWYMFSFVPSTVVNENFTPLWNDIVRLLGIMVAVFIVMFVAFSVNFEVNENRLEKLAYEDSLTKGDNYEAFKVKIQQQKDLHGSLISMDLGEFRVVNNVCGVEMGNEVLRNVWRLLENTLEKNELAAHISADFFIFYWEEREDIRIEERLHELSQKIIELEEQLKIPRMIPYYGIASIVEAEEVEKAYSRARQAKNVIKGRHDLNYAFYDEGNFKNLVENKRLEDNFEKAIQQKEFEVWYQPKFDTNTREIVGAEALVRWRENGKLISPGRFIPLFEKNGMISVLDEYVFREVCKKQKEWQESGRKIYPVSINISRASLFFRDIAAKYETIIKEVGLSPKYAQLEITESATLENGDIESLMDQFHVAGFRLLLDDFGNGYSSLSTLNKMSFDTLKLDKSLIDYIGDQNGEELLYHTICLAKKFGLTITAEGVEKEEQVLFLQKLKCDDIQGFYFSKPLPVEEFEQMAFGVAG